METDEIVYRIDNHDCIVSVSPSWNAFAVANGADSLVAEQVLNRCLWDYINDAETLYLHKALVKRVRQGRNLRGLAFRCDSPGLRRFMTMDLLLLQDGMVEYRCRLDRIELREALPVSRLRDGSDALLRMCGWCQRVQESTGDWSEIEQVVGILEWIDPEEGIRITHGLCDRCHHDLLWQINACEPA